MPDPDPLAQQRAATAQMAQASNFGRQPSGQLKGPGFLGMFKLPGNHVASEYSIAESDDLKDAKGNYLDYPSLVPTLTRDEVLMVLKAAQAPEGSKESQLPESIINKATDWALGRKQQGLPLFAQPGEQYPLYPDIPRVSVQWPSGDISLPNESGQTDPRLGKLGYEDIMRR